jgi:transposase-like protein
VLALQGPGKGSHHRTEKGHLTAQLASRKDWDALKHDVKPIYTAVNAGPPEQPWMS